MFSWSKLEIHACTAHFPNFRLFSENSPCSGRSDQAQWALEFRWNLPLEFAVGIPLEFADYLCFIDTNYRWNFQITAVGIPLEFRWNSVGVF
eukprot:9496302-Pyramimonas_sp.AAC.2